VVLHTEESTFLEIQKTVKYDAVYNTFAISYKLG